MLNRRIRNFREDEGGFTLIELLVVILIIGILAAVALPTFLNQGKKGADAAAKSDARASITKIEACATETNSYAKCKVGASGADPAAPTLPTGVTFTPNATDDGYTVAATTNGKGTKGTWTFTSAAGAVTGPVGS